MQEKPLRREGDLLIRVFEYSLELELVPVEQGSRELQQMREAKTYR